METGKKNLKFWIAAGVAIALLALMGWLGKPAYRHFKERHSQAQARAFMARGDYRNALLSARQALLLNPANIEACRVMAGLADISHSPATLDWWRKIAGAEPTTGNKLSLASASLHYENPPFPLADQIFSGLPDSATNLVAFHTVAAEFALRTKRFADAQTHLEQAVRLDPTNKIFRLNLAVVELNTTNTAMASAARDVLKQFQSDNDVGAMALRSLIADRLVQDDLAGALEDSTRLLYGAHAETGDRLQHLDILRRLKSPDLAAQLNSVEQQSATNAIAASETAAWMEANGFLANAVQWLDHLPGNFQKQPTVRLALADGYLAEGDWQALRAFTSAGGWDEMDFLRLAFLSHAWAELDEPLVARSNWRAAVDEAGNHFDALTVLLETAERWGLKNEREELLWRIVEKFPGERPASQELEGLYFAIGDTAELNRLYAALFAAFPKDAGIENNLAATSLLLKTNLASSVKMAEEARAQNPANPSFVSTYAYALHLQGQTGDGLAALEKLKSSSLEEPSTALYYGVLLSALGEKEKAAHFLALAEKDAQLLPEEKQLLANARKAK